MTSLATKVLELMLACREKLVELGRDESGASAIEYALIVGLIVGVLVTVFSTFGDQIEGLFNSVGSDIGEATGSDGTN
ncbi:Flp family type IVb pilin [uncultured Halovibrio sp.]|uniref:Flp family type IVb pilin n=1 Tax=uncultured Halovibrio sp. TaxID=985049 RepID=UPI0025E49CBF|nr:Flp family type IVb pilin [uncultured Halovibrio sp.]